MTGGRARILAAGQRRHHWPVRLGEAALRARISPLTPTRTPPMLAIPTAHRLALAALLLAGSAPAALAQTYPAQNINMIVAFAAGGIADVVGRLVGQKAGERLGRSVVVENRGGAGGNLAARPGANPRAGPSPRRGPTATRSLPQPPQSRSTIPLRATRAMPPRTCARWHSSPSAPTSSRSIRAIRRATSRSSSPTPGIRASP